MKSGFFFMGIANNSINLFDNPFIKISAYKLDSTYNLKEEV